MNSVFQLILNLSVLLYGMLFLLPFSGKTNYLVYLALSWFIGWGIIGNTEIILVMCGISVTISKIVPAAFIVLLLSKTLVTLSFKELDLNKACWERFAKNNMLIGIIFFIGVFICFIYFANYIYYTTDVLVSEALSRIFHNFGSYANEKHRLFYTLLNQRLPLHISVQSIARLSGVERYSSFSGITIFFLCLAVCGFWKGHRQRLDKAGKIWLCAIIGLLISNCLIRTHVFTPLSNIITMGYFSVGVLCLCGYIKKKDILFFIIACFLLGCTGIIRKEMLFFALIPFMIMVWQNHMPDMRNRIIGLFLYMLTAFSWHIWGILKIWSPEIVTSGLKTSSHGGYLIVFVLLLLTPMAFIFPERLIRKKITKLFIVVVIIIGSLFFIYHYNERLIHSVNRLLSLMFEKKGRWGIFWSLPILAILMYAILFLCTKLNIHSSSEVSFENIKQSVGFNCNFLLLTIIVFIVLRILLYAIFTGPKDTDFWSSGNRILMHIYPVTVYFLGKLGYTLENISPPMNKD